MSSVSLKSMDPSARVLALIVIGFPFTKATDAGIANVAKHRRRTSKRNKRGDKCIANVSNNRVSMISKSFWRFFASVYLCVIRREYIISTLGKKRARIRTHICVISHMVEISGTYDRVFFKITIDARYPLDEASS